ncbi:MAG: hypothetical protein H6625_07910 [Bdellovibrionaceae bacterium]|nr:hypothetical protein [Pseudobdellovibrionaceae bacterium]
MRESWWIDVLEGEYEGDKFLGVEVLSKHLEADNLVINDLKKVKSIVKEQIDDELPEDELYYKKLHTNIMTSIYEYESSQKIENKKKIKHNQTQLNKIKIAKYYFSMNM